MRLLLPLLFLALPATAETYVVSAPVTEATVFPQGAMLTRRIAFDAPAGRHRLLVPGLPDSTQSELLSVTGATGATVGVLTLAQDRPFPTGDRTTAEVAAAEAEVERLEQAVAARERDIAAIRARAEAAQAQAAFLSSLGKAETAPAGTADELQAIARMVGAEVLAARTAAIGAEAEAAAAERAAEDDREALEEARRALAALAAGPQDGLVLALEIAAQGGPGVVELTGFSDEAGWAPLYDLRLTRGETTSAVLDRSIMVQQQTGEDWTGVALTFSTATPQEQLDASKVYADLRRIISEEELDRLYGSSRASGGYAESAAPPGAVVEPEVIVEEMSAGAMYEGETLTFVYPEPVDLRSGADFVRLALDDVTLSAETFARAAPMSDESAFLVAEITNTSGELLMNGMAILWLDGAMIGTTELPVLAVATDTEIGFGPIRGLMLNRTVPGRSEGARGVLSRSTAFEETAVIEVENRTARAWPLRLTDRVPYSEQDDLVIDWSADPRPDLTDVDGERGILEWRFDIAPGETRTVTLRHRLTWPSGWVLQ